MPRVKRPQRASLDEVRIERDREYAVITFADDTIGGMNLKLGLEVQRMTDLDILERFNEAVADMEANVNAWDRTVIEIPAGKPQIEYAASSQQWVPVGDVLRCIIDEGDDGQPAIWIDARFLIRQSKEAYAPLYVHCLTIYTNALVDANRVEEAYVCMNEAVTVLPDGLAGDTVGQSALLAQRHFNLSILATRPDETKRRSRPPRGRARFIKYSPVMTPNGMRAYSHHSRT
jgi:hypothetical protein